MYRYLLLSLLVICTAYRPTGGADADKQVMQAAASQMEVFLNKIEPGSEADYGFTTADHTDACTVGKPYRVLAFSSDLYYKPLAEDKDYIIIKNEWRVPVMLNGQIRVLLTITGSSGNYSVTDMTEPQLARELQLKGTSMSNDDTWYLLRIPAIAADFFVSEHDNSFADAQFMPLASAITNIPALSKTHKPIYTITEVQQMVKEAYAKKAASDAQPKKKAAKKHK
jgi:hypothetical protein